MKVLHKIMIAVSASVLAACASEHGEDIFNVPRDGYTFFEADFEAVDFEGSLERLWERGTGIGVFGSAEGANERYVLKQAFDGRPAGEFYGPKVSGAPICAYYPYSEDFSLLNGRLPYSLSPVQEYDGTASLYGQFCRYSGTVYAFSRNGGRLEFGHASGLLTVETRLDAAKTVRSVSVSSSRPVAGTGGVGEDMSVTLDADGPGTIVLECGDGILSKDVDGFRKFPIVMPAGTYHDVNIALTFDDGGTIETELGVVNVVRIAASDCQIKEIVITINGLGGFEVEGDLEFEPRS